MQRRNFSLHDALNDGQIRFKTNGNIVVVIERGASLVSQNNSTNISGITNSAIVVNSENSSATTSVQQTSGSAELDKAMETLMSFVVAHLSPETAKVGEDLIKQATEEAKKPNRDESKLKGLLGILEPVIKTAAAVPELLNAFTGWSHLLGL